MSLDPKPPGHTGLIGKIAILFATVVVLAGLSEVVARRLFAESDESTLPCLNVSDPVNGVTARPGTVCRYKFAESALTEYRFNACGHRTAGECRAASAEQADRIVLVGSSLVEGFGVPMESTFSYRLAAELTRLTHRPVATYNEGMQWGTPRSVGLRLQEVIDEKPSRVLWPLTPFDIQNAGLRLPYIPGLQEEDHGQRLLPPAASKSPAASKPPDAAPVGPMDRLAASYAKRGGLAGMVKAGVDKALDPLRQSRAVLAVRHVLFGNQREYLKHFASNLAESNYLHDDLPGTPGVSTKSFEENYALVSDRLRAAGIPLYVSLLPSHAQVSLLSGAVGDFPGLDARRLDERVKAIVQSHRDVYLDVFPSFANLPEPGRYFFAVDEHMNEQGHALVAAYLAQALASYPSYPARRSTATASATPAPSEAQGR